jgi:hypothetical protein
MWSMASVSCEHGGVHNQPRAARAASVGIDRFISEYPCCTLFSYLGLPYFGGLTIPDNVVEGP